MQQIQRVLVALMLLPVLILSGCGGLPDDLHSQAKAMPQAFESAQQDIDKRKQSFESRKKSEDWGFLQPYADREKLSEKFSAAKAALAHAKTVFDTEAKVILDRDESNEAQLLTKQFSRVNLSLKEARNLSQEPEKRLQFLLQARKEAPQWIEQAAKEEALTRRYLDETKAVAVKAQSEYPAKKEDIDGRVAPLIKLGGESSEALHVSKKELEAASTDYAVLGDSIRLVSSNLEKVLGLKQNLEAKLGELYRSYSKVLVDMRIEHYVEIGRTSWDDYSDWPTEHQHLYRVKIDEKVGDYFDTVTADPIATYSKGWGSSRVNVNIDNSMWQALRIDPGESWPSGDDSAEFWMQDANSKAYHKYVVVENDQKKETGWEDVSEDYFWQQEENLGLTVVSKPYGMYEEETVKQAAPAGMEYVAKPTMVNGQPTGSNQYGHWNGGFWQFYGQYAFLRDLLGGSSYRPYGYNDWQDYDRRDRSRPYYGTRGQWGTYGNTTYGSGRYKNTDYVRRNPGVVTEAGHVGQSAGRRSASPSVRGAGPTSRGGGPGGGGK